MGNPNAKGGHPETAASKVAVGPVAPPGPHGTCRCVPTPTESEAALQSDPSHLCTGRTQTELFGSCTASAKAGVPPAWALKRTWPQKSGLFTRCSAPLTPRTRFSAPAAGRGSRKEGCKRHFLSMGAPDHSPSRPAFPLRRA